MPCGPRSGQYIPKKDTRKIWKFSDAFIPMRHTDKYKYAKVHKYWNRWEGE